MVGQISLNGVAVYAYVLADGDGVRVRVSVDDWERLGLSPGQRVRYDPPGRTGLALLLAKADHDPPGGVAVPRPPHCRPPGGLTSFVG
jgi:hypothetical protein